MIPAFEASQECSSRAHRPCENQNPIIARRRCSCSTDSRRCGEKWVTMLYSRRLSCSMTALPFEKTSHAVVPAVRYPETNSPSLKIVTPSIDKNGNIVAGGGYDDLGRAVRSGLSRSIRNDGNFVRDSTGEWFPVERRTQSTVSAGCLNNCIVYTSAKDILAGVYYLE
ncbi:hypothetical protein GUITHDRAFT_150820 [Guillardia theta CCMP2712]|uniref:Uncharacterized protein n=1 Tax=Guillardia theta (strain CCMP2712) TaxID=905079 RepID=L1JUR1_GUITC|nr:hypothetical protein GUITHDRAFT_150820 [Guillardia theta CCMP2712]EKX51813.1 hypothetical protein GUITHDRAFT_150820 [Guillardia theta CCMP2712]|eukprot:XP_005838793.1 hypothetical protein GUITHDRAFT_150820 [Guillardia theta CCMP2712]